MSSVSMPVIQVFSAGMSGKKAGAARLGRADVLRAITRHVGDGQFVNIAPDGEPQIAALQFSISGVGPGGGTMTVLLSDLPALIDTVRALMENPDAIGIAKEVDAEFGADTFNRTVSVKNGLISFMPAPGHGQGSATDWELGDVRKLGVICASALHNDLGGGYVPALDANFVRDYVPAGLIEKCRGHFKTGDRIVNFDTSLHAAYAPAADVSEVSAATDVSEVSAAPDDGAPADDGEVSAAAIQAEPPAGGKGPRRAKNK